jgi:hypothetical protein
LRLSLRILGNSTKEILMASDRLSMALRRNQGRRHLPEFLEEVSTSLGRPADAILRLDLEATLAALEAYRAALDRCSRGEIPFLHRTWPAQDRQQVVDLLAAARDAVEMLPLLLFRILSEYCGAVQTDSKEVLDRSLQLVSLDQEELMSSSPDASEGIYLAHFTQPGTGDEQQVYILTVWGPRILEAFEVA